MNNTENVRVRYGRVGNDSKNLRPKNTLVTLRDGDNIYFGISRCNLSEGDNFLKHRGRQIAASRAALAANENESYDLFPGTNLEVHPSALRGRVRRENVVELLNVFNNIDQLLYDRAVAARTDNHVEV